MEDNITDSKLLSERELYWITFLDCYYPRGFNFMPPNEVIDCGKFYKIKHIKTNSIIDIINLKEFCRKNKIGYKAMNAMLMGKTIQSHGYCLPETSTFPIKKTLKIPVELENVITGEMVNVINLTDFCKT